MLPVVVLLMAASATSARAEDPAPPPPTTDPAPVADPAPPVTDPVPAEATGPSSTPIASWGTAKVDSTKKAQRVNAVVEAGGIAYLGGQFTTMVAPGGGSSTSRGYLAAIDGTTGDLTGWNPMANGKVWAMELSADQTSLYVGGDFSSIGGRSAYKLAKIDLDTGKLDTGFHPVVKGRVRALALDGDRLYVGGDFTSISGQARPKLAALDPVTGTVLSWTPPPLGRGRYIGHTGIPTPDYSPGHVFAVQAIGGKVFAAGTFLDLGGQAGLATLDAVTGAVAEPYYDPGRPIFDLATSGGVLFAVGGGPGGRVYAFSPDEVDKTTPLWKAKFDGDAVGVAVSATAVYVAGHYDYIVSTDSSCYQYCPGGPTRHHLSAFAAADGSLLAWNPTADTSTGPFALAAGDGALYVGGEFNKISGETQPGFAIFPGTP